MVALLYYCQVYISMGIADEVFLKIGRVMKLCKYQRQDDEMLVSINNIWSEFIFKDIKGAKALKERGYDFTLIGQDIYDKGVDIGIPTAHYSYLLVVTYNKRLIDLFNHLDSLKKVLYDELITDYINIVDTPVRYSSVYKQETSAGIFIYTHDNRYQSTTIRLNSILGDSLAYMNVSIPYLRFYCNKSIRLCNFRSDLPRLMNTKDILHIIFDTHMNGSSAEKINCHFTI